MRKKQCRKKCRKIENNKYVQSYTNIRLSSITYILYKAPYIGIQLYINMKV